MSAKYRNAKHTSTKEIEPGDDRVIPSTSDSSIDSQSSSKELLRNHGWSRKSKDFFQESSKKTFIREPFMNQYKNNKQCTFTLWIKSMYFPSYTMERLNQMDSKPYIYLTWTFLELQDKAYSTIIPANKAIFNCSSVYKGDITIEMLHHMCSNKVKVECRVVLKNSSQIISFGEIDVLDAIYKPNAKCKYKVCLDGPNNMTAVVSCWFKFDCLETLLRKVMKK